ncbi:hypothetical protein LOTGIDRAFT_167866 [Lottia gigantea]|uniref:LysM domain-containing protein n=1 Tax=Lottia gigantea TaxID=225164 RepID=V3ZWF4_LOTGI|nr:hypothetical protein LOTGIDRAFT_167866 [Lottia gigantea]ESO85291.1 hypothetical protein LOTGIDRAFT_167866 [Lottia gigantea]
MKNTNLKHFQEFQLEELELKVVVMANGENENERQHLSMFVRSQTKYGTTSGKCIGGNVPLAEKATRHIRHNVSPEDTLMGIALKYHVSVEQIKRLNQLWTNDSLFLRQHILVPLLPTNQDIVPKELIVEVSDRYNSSNEEQPKETSPQQVVSTESGMDFLNKYDLDIAQLKSNLQKIEKAAVSNDRPYGASMRQSLGSPYDLPTDPDTQC